jgi:hypothetical protein
MQEINDSTLEERPFAKATRTGCWNAEPLAHAGGGVLGWIVLFTVP